MLQGMGAPNATGVAVDQAVISTGTGMCLASADASA